MSLTSFPVEQKEASNQGGVYEPVIDPTFGDPTVAEIRDQITKENFSGAENLFQSELHPDDRAFFAKAIAEWPGCPRWLETWFESNGQSPTMHLLRGVHAIGWAWEARGRGYSETVGEEAARLFFRRLERADLHLNRAVALHPSDPTPWAFMIRVGRGRQLDPAQIGQRFENVLDRAPEHRLAHSEMLQSLCWKWSGSKELMPDFVSATIRRAAQGSPLHTLVCEAHIEHWLQAWNETDEQSAANYFKSRKVHEELITAAAAYFDSPDFQPSIDSIRNRNFFAYCFWCCGDLGNASIQFKEIGPRATEAPWSYSGDALETFKRARHESIGN